MFRHLVDKYSQDKIYNIQDCQGHSQSASSVSSSLQIKLFVVASSVIFLSNTVNSFQHFIRELHSHLGNFEHSILIMNIDLVQDIKFVADRLLLELDNINQ